MKEAVLKNAEYYTKEQENQYFDRKSSRIKLEDILKHLVVFVNTGEGN